MSGFISPQYVIAGRLGLRPPQVISPYAKRDDVAYAHHEHGSIFTFIEDQFRLARLAASDERAKSPEADYFNFTHPRKFTPIQAHHNRTYFLNPTARSASAGHGLRQVG